MSTKILTKIIQQYQERHQRLPKEIIIHPVALPVFALRESLAPLWQGIPVRCLEVEPVVNPTFEKLGITIINGKIRSFDL